MARPVNKSELLTQASENYTKLLSHIGEYTPEQRSEPFPEGTLNRNIRDVLAHLYHWHLMMQDWYEVGMKGEKPDIPAKGYTWKTSPELNKWINEEYSAMPLEEAFKKLDDSHRQVMQLIEDHTDEELFTKKKYKWTGTTSLGAYLISSTSSHYDWAYKLIRKAKK
jgi:hypothetical protein